MTTRSPFLVGLMTLVLAACGMAMGGGSSGQAQGTAHATQSGETTETLPFACSLVATREGSGTHVRGHLQAHQALSASYALKVRGPGVAIDQGGDLSLGAGETTLLGEARLSGAAEARDSTLTVTVDGRSYACPVQEG